MGHPAIESSKFDLRVYLRFTRRLLPDNIGQSMGARSGRQREAEEIVQYKKAAQVGRLLLGELDGPMESISVEQFLGKPRKELISEREALRTSLRGEIAKFCRNNFENMEPEDSAKLYDVLFEHRSEWFLPYAEFEREFGRFRPSVLKGAPLHSTVRISPWGLQTEFPDGVSELPPWFLPRAADGKFILLP